MTTPPDPFGRNPFGGTPPPLYAGPLPPVRVNTLATLSVIFAFVFAPVGAVLAHLGLSAIRRTGQPGRRRALIGMTASYVILAVAVVVTAAMLLAATEKACACTPPPQPQRPAAAPPTEPHVAPAALERLLTAPRDGDAAMTLKQTRTGLTLMPGSVNPAGCLAVISVGDPRLYDSSAERGHYRTDYINNQSPGYAQVEQAVTAYDSVAAAAAARSRITKGWDTPGWESCREVTEEPSGHTYRRYTHGAFGPDGSLVEAEDDSDPLKPRIVHAVAAKANVVVDVLATVTLTHHADAAAVAKAILARIPG